MMTASLKSRLDGGSHGVGKVCGEKEAKQGCEKDPTIVGHDGEHDDVADADVEGVEGGTCELVAPGRPEGGRRGCDGWVDVERGSESGSGRRVGGARGGARVVVGPRL